MYETRNGWTKARMIAQIKRKNNGTRSQGWVTMPAEGTDGRSLKGLSSMLRGDKGNCCFIGCFIPDERYNPEMEARGILHTRIECSDIMPLDPYHGMGGLMGAHDNALKTTKEMHAIGKAWIEANVVDA